MKVHLRLIGDVHGKSDPYLRLCRKAKYTIQLGDHGFEYSHLTNLMPSRHKVLGGNHDNYDKITDWPHYLGDYGSHQIPQWGCIFYIRGGFSLDWQYRAERVSWWQDEEMSMSQCHKALDYYEQVRPSFVISHECPMEVVRCIVHPMLVIKTRTNQLLNQMFTIHQPKMWVFAHYHKSWRQSIKGTEFVCLNELECLDLRSRK